jgi:hypothetical protein
LKSTTMLLLRAILALSRPAYLPTIWSNCLAGWWLGGEGNGRSLPWLFGGATLLYLGGAFLKTTFEAELDREHSRAEPMPAGLVSQQSLWRWGVGLLALGALLAFGAGEASGVLALALVVLVVAHHATHRLNPFSPVLKGLGRFFLYALGASAAQRGVTGWSLWCGLALGAYVSGLGYLAIWARAPRAAPAYWPALLLTVPVGLALLMDAGPYREPGLLLGAIFFLWVTRSLRYAFWPQERDLPRALSGLVAGIVLADWLAVCPVRPTLGQGYSVNREVSLVFIGLFLLTLALQQMKMSFAEDASGASSARKT